MTRCSASSSEEPRSRNTLPLDGVTFSLLFAGIGPSPVHERVQAILGELQIVFRRLSRALLEGVEDIHGFGKRGDVEHPVFQARMNPDLPDARTNGGLAWRWRIESGGRRRSRRCGGGSAALRWRKSG